MYAVVVQNTDTLELSLMGPYDTQAYAQLIRESFVDEMDARYGILDVYSVWVVPLRTMNTEIAMFTSLFNLYNTTFKDARTLEEQDEFEAAYGKDAL